MQVFSLKFHKIFRQNISKSAKHKINVFDISNKINPTLIQTISSYGKNPRDMDFYDNYLLVCNVDSNNISIFKFDKILKF